MTRSDSVSIKELLLLLNLKSAKSGNEYVLQYNYSYHPGRKSIFTRSVILEFNSRKLIKKYQLYSQEKIVEFLANEIKLYD